jgi:hypothetical protein
MVTLENLTMIICGVMLAIFLIAYKLAPSYVVDRKNRYIQPPRGKK